MIQIDHIQVFGFGHALRNMRNPHESWARADSDCTGSMPQLDQYGIESYELKAMGRADFDLLCRLVHSGAEHRKVLRTVGIWCDIVPWRGMWQELDTYKIATVRDSCSTMHKLGFRDLTPGDFQDQDLDEDEVDRAYLAKINRLGAEYRTTKDVDTLMRIKHRLPEGYLQRSGYHFNYENALNMFIQRRLHRVPQWRWGGAGTLPDPELARKGYWPSFCDMLWQLPFFDQLVQCDPRW